MVRIFVQAEEDELVPNKVNVQVGFPKVQHPMSIKTSLHLLTSGISLLIKSSPKLNGEKDHVLIKSVIDHLNDDFMSTESFQDVAVDDKLFMEGCIPKVEIKTLISKEIIGNCYSYYSMDVPSEYKQFFLEEFAKKFDELILEKCEDENKLEYLKERLGRIKVINSHVN